MNSYCVQMRGVEGTSLDYGFYCKTQNAQLHFLYFDNSVVADFDAGPITGYWIVNPDGSDNLGTQPPM